MESFFQSHKFGEFQQKIPSRGKVWDVDSVLVIRQKLPLGLCWLWVPYGRLGAAGSSGQQEIAENRDFLEKTRHIAKEERAVFVRVEPILKTTQWKIVPSPTRYTPEHTLVLDIEKSEAEIFAQMKPKGRYNISVAKKKGVRIEMISGDKFRAGAEFDEFYKILRATADRDGFGIHQKFYYEELLKTFGDDAAIFMAYAPPAPNYPLLPIAGIIVIFHKDTATYYYGASNYANRNFVAPYLLQWAAMCEAKRRSMKYYDFLGIAPPDSKTHSWKGVTEFKKKFGGREVTYPPAFDIVYKPTLYKSLSFYKKIRADA